MATDSAAPAATPNPRLDAGAPLVLGLSLRSTTTSSSLELPAITRMPQAKRREALAGGLPLPGTGHTDQGLDVQVEVQGVVVQCFTRAQFVVVPALIHKRDMWTPRPFEVSGLVDGEHQSFVPDYAVARRDDRYLVCWIGDTGESAPDDAVMHAAAEALHVPYARYWRKDPGWR